MLQIESLGLREQQPVTVTVMSMSWGVSSSCQSALRFDLILALAQPVGPPTTIHSIWLKQHLSSGIPHGC